MFKLLDGRKLASEIRISLSRKIAKNNLQLTLAAILVGSNPASLLYLRIKEKACREVGIGFRKFCLPANSSQKAVLSLIKKLNSQKSISGIIVQLPLPKQLNTNEIISAINPQKDIDGLHPENLGRLLIGNPRIVPPTPAGIISLLKAYRINFSGKDVVLVGYGKLVGKPLAAMLAVAQKDATVTICNAQTKNLAEFTKKADILISATGAPHLIKANMVKQGVIIVDAGTTVKKISNFQFPISKQIPKSKIRNPKKISGISEKRSVVGDVDFDNVAKKCAYITPPTGGVGPMTVAKILENLVDIN